MNKNELTQLPTEERFFTYMLMVRQRILAEMERELEASGLSMVQAWALKHVVEAEKPLGTSELAGCLRSGKSNATQLVDRMAADGLVERTPDPDDRRRVLIIATAAGHARHEQAKGVHRQIIGRILSTLQPAEQAQFLSYLHQIATCDCDPT